MNRFLDRLGLGRIQKSPRIVRLLLAQQFLEGLVPITALYAIMFERVGGLSLEQIGILFSIWSLSFLLAELPSGVLADYWSRKNVIILGGVLRGAGFAVWILWPTFLGYAIGFALWGITIACCSGAITAYLHNELRADGKDKQFAKYYGWIMSSRSTGMLAGFFVAAALTLEHTHALIVLSLISSLAYAAVLIPAVERPYKKQDTYLKTLKSGFREVAHSKKLRYICYILFSVYMIIGVLEELLPRLYAGFGLNDRAVSLVIAASMLVSIFLLTRLEALVRFSLTKQVLVTCGGMVVLLAGLYVGGVGGSLFILMFALIFNLFRPVFQHHVQEAAQGDDRATIGSIPGLAGGLFGAGAFSVIGLMAAASNERFSIGIYGFFWLLVLAALAFMGRRYSGSTETIEAGYTPPPAQTPST